MKYYLIVGEASGDLHASRLMNALKENDAQAEFRFFGGDFMSAVGGTRVKHYSELAYMGFVPVLTHLHVIMRNMTLCKRDITEWGPDVVILVDYPGFNLNIARYVHASTDIPVYYYISPKIWAWKEWRIKDIKRNVDELFSILPFEIPFFEKKHGYPIHYVGNPTAGEVGAFLDGYKETKSEFCNRVGLEEGKPVVALLPGSRRQEIKDNLPAMILALRRFPDCQPVLACSPGIPDEYYDAFAHDGTLRFVHGETYALLANADAAVVTSGTATLETALFGVPQVVCYKTPLPGLISWLRRKLIHVRYISLVNLIADAEVVKELVADTFSVDNIAHELSLILPGGEGRKAMLDGYASVRERLGREDASQNAARIICDLLRSRSAGRRAKKG